MVAVMDAIKSRQLAAVSTEVAVTFAYLFLFQLLFNEGVLLTACC